MWNNKKPVFVLVLTLIPLLTLAQATYPLTITKIETKDLLPGVPRTSFRRGEIVVIETEISAPLAYYYAQFPLDYLQIITLWHGNSMLGLLMTRTRISAGETKSFGGGIGIRLTDPIGTYGIEVYVWNGFPSEKGADWTPLAPAGTTSITVTG